MKKRLIQLIIVFALMIFILSFLFIFRPAYWSTSSVCFEKELPCTVKRAGMIIINQTNNQTDVEIKIFERESTPEYEIAEKHEYCHLQQYKQGRFYSCDIPALVYLNEVECYTAQYLPNSIYNLFYER